MDYKILNQGWIYSRERVEEQHMMANDNASDAVMYENEIAMKNELF